MNLSSSYSERENPKNGMTICQEAFETIREFLTNPLVLKPIEPDRSLLPYLSIIDEALGSMLAQEDEDGSEHTVYYLSKKLKDYETRYTAVEKSCFALVWAIQKLRHILLSYQVHVITRMDPLKYLFEKLALTRKLSRWLILLAKFDLTYVAKNTIKGRAIAEFYADHPVNGEALNDDFLDEEILTTEVSNL